MALDMTVIYSASIKLPQTQKRIALNRDTAYEPYHRREDDVKEDCVQFGQSNQTGLSLRTLVISL